MLAAELDLVSDLAVVRVALFHVEVYQETEVVVESEELIFGLPVLSQLLFELVDITTTLDVP